MSISRRADVATVAVILDAGVDTDAADNNGNTPLGEAAVAGNLATAEFLIEQRAVVNAETLSGETPIWAAVRSGELLVVELMIEHGANVDGRARVGRWSGLTAADLADAEGHQEIADRLRSQ